MPKKILKGIVISDKMDKTRSVLVEYIKTHKKYRKQYKVGKKYIVKDEKNQSKKGDQVSIVETKPFSKRGRWEIVNSKIKTQKSKPRIKNKNDKEKIKS